jgi:hypothetical protein
MISLDASLRLPYPARTFHPPKPDCFAHRVEDVVPVRSALCRPLTRAATKLVAARVLNRQTSPPFAQIDALKRSRRRSCFAIAPVRSLLDTKLCQQERVILIAFADLVVATA